MKRSLIYLCLLTLVSACWEPPYRYDVRGNGQGGVDIQHVPKDPQTPAPPAAAPAPPPVEMTDQQKVDQLQAQVKALSAENEKLKQQLPATLPATNPGKE